MQRIEEYNPLDGRFFLVSRKNGNLLAKVFSGPDAVLVANVEDLQKALKRLHDVLDEKLPDGRAVNQHLPAEIFERFSGPAREARMVLSKIDWGQT